MPEIYIGEPLWQDLMAAARHQQRRARILVEQAVRELLERLADEELLARSEREARRAKFTIEQTEAIIRQHRRKPRSA